jgi:Arc/MetJ-type ribon-helix-helix transcriptional regulator
MDIALDPDIERRIKDKVRSGEFASADELVQQALQCFLDLEVEDLVETRKAL